MAYQARLESVSSFWLPWVRIPPSPLHYFLSQAPGYPTPLKFLGQQKEYYEKKQCVTNHMGEYNLLTVNSLLW